MMNLHAHSTTYNLRLPAAPSVTHTRIADIDGEHALPFWLLCLLVWIVVRRGVLGRDRRVLSRMVILSLCQP